MFNNKKLSGKILCGAFATSIVAALSASAAGNTAMSGAAKDVLNKGDLYDFLCKNYGKVALTIGVIILFVWYLHNRSSSHGNSSDGELGNVINEENVGTIMQDALKLNRPATVEEFNAVYTELMQAFYPYIKGKDDPEKLEEGKFVSFYRELIKSGDSFLVSEITMCVEKMKVNGEDKQGNSVPLPKSIEFWNLIDSTGSKIFVDKGTVKIAFGDIENNFYSYITTVTATCVDLKIFKEEVLKFLDDYKSETIPNVGYRNDIANGLINNVSRN